MKNVDEATFVKYLYSVKVHSLAFHMGLELLLEPNIKYCIVKINVQLMVRSTYWFYFQWTKSRNYLRDCHVLT